MAYIKIDKENFFYNLKQLSLKSGDKRKIAAVLKDNAYGHGLKEMASLASEFGLKEAVVINTKEAKKIEHLFENILILNDTPIFHPRFSFAITSLEALKVAPKDAKIELKIDTGMHRNGIALDELTKALEIIKKRKLNFFGAFTHFKSADELSSELFWQMKNFQKVKEQIIAKGFRVRFHSFNSAALLRTKSFDEDIARVGIAIYGYYELPPIFDEIKLKPVLSLWAKRVNTRKLYKGQRVGYGGDFIAPKDMLVSTYDIGYGHGLFRGNSKKPFITAEGLPILGRVSMDFITLESSKDEVCIFNNAKIVAKHFNTISYEITTALKPNIKRVITP